MALVIGDADTAAIREFEEALDKLAVEYNEAEKKARALREENELLAASLKAMALDAQKNLTIDALFANLNSSASTAVSTIKNLATSFAPWNEALDHVSGSMKQYVEHARAAASTAMLGAQMGSAFGPLGTVIGGVAGAFVGLIKRTDEQTEASKRAAAAAKNHAAALKLVADGETSARVTRRSARENFEKAQKENSAAAQIVADQIKKYGAASEGAYADKLRAKRALEDAEDLRESLNKAGGNIWLEERKQYRERERAIDDINAARQRAYITDEEAQRRLDALNGVEEKATQTITKHTEAIYANVGAALAAQGVTRRTDTAHPVIGFSTSLGAAADTNTYDFYGRVVDEQRITEGIEQRRQAGLTADWMKRIGEQQEKKRSLLESLGIDDSTSAKLKVATAALGAFKEGFGSTVQAIATGSMSAGEAFKQLAGTVLNSVGAKLAGLAAEQFIEAGVSAILLNPVGAAQHTAAGLLYTAGAVAAYAAGGKLSGGGGGSAPSASGAAGGGGGARSLNVGSSSSNGPSERIIVFAGSAFARNTPRMQQIEAEKAVDEVFGAIGARNR